MNELREEMAVCAHMRVNYKKVLLDSTESGRISDSWVCGDCGTLFIPEAANREQKAEIERLKAELNRYPADWWQDSSLKTWFPLTAEELDRLKAELASLRASVGEKWIDVKQGMPQPREKVLIWSKQKGISVDWHPNGDCRSGWWENNAYDVTHWKPLATPPSLPGEEK